MLRESETALGKEAELEHRHTSEDIQTTAEEGTKDLGAKEKSNAKTRVGRAQQPADVRGVTAQAERQGQSPRVAGGRRKSFRADKLYLLGLGNY